MSTRAERLARRTPLEKLRLNAAWAAHRTVQVLALVESTPHPSVLRREAAEILTYAEALEREKLDAAKEEFGTC